MRRFFALFCLLFCLLCFFSIKSEPSSSVFWVGEIRGTINPASADFFKTLVHGAQAEKAQAVLLELDTPGGLVASVREMAQIISDSEIPVIVFVFPAGAAATSAGALLMLASSTNAMSSGTNIGAAHPVNADGKAMEGATEQKAVQDTAAFARGLAELRGRDPKLAEKIVSQSTSYTSQEAKKLGLVDLIAESRVDLMNQLEGREIQLKSGLVKLHTSAVVFKEKKMNLGQWLLHLLANPNIAAVLMTLGMLLIYLEVATPGITIAGVLGIVCLVIAFMSFQVLPIHTGGVALLILGILLMGAEPFVPSGGALGVGGAVSFILGMIWMIDPEKSNVSVSPYVFVPAGLALGSIVLLLGYTLSMTKKKSKEVSARIGGAGIGGLSGFQGHVEWLDETGKVGKAQIRGEVWDIVSQEILSVGDAIEPLALEGFRVVVKKASVHKEIP